MGRETVQTNSWAVLRYLEVLWSKYERMTAVPDSPMNRKEKGLSKPPVSDNALLLMRKNAEASRVMEPLIRDLRAHDVSHGGVAVNGVLNAVRDDPSSVRRWRAANDTNTPGEDLRMWRALRAACVLLSQALAANHDGDEPYVLRVVTDPTDDEAKDKAEEAQGFARYTVHHANLRIARSVEELREEGYTLDAAIATKAERMMWSEVKVREAVEYAQQQGAA